MDVHYHWIPKITGDFGVPCALFYVIPASSLVFFGPYDGPEKSRTTPEYFTVPPSWIPFPSNLAYRLHEAQWVAMAEKENKLGGLGIHQRAHLIFQGSEFICVMGCFELDSKWLSLLAELYKKDVVPVGLLAPPAEDPSSERENKVRELEFDAIKWLNEYSRKSVLYIALGSEAALSTELLHELAFGLEKSEVPFLWALRKPAGMIGDTSDMLPAGFHERIKGFGHVALGWVPQMRILAHSSVGGFLTHCGPSSVIESLQFGHPLVMLPLIIDQGLIARVLVERGVGIEVPRDFETGNFDREGVASTIHRVMVEEEGKMIRRNAEQIQPIYEDKISQEKHIDGFIKRLHKYNI